MKFCQLWLTCGSKEEADKIADVLLVKHLVACVRQLPITSKYRWKGKIVIGKEVLLQMESKLENFNKVETEVKKLHSYDAFSLEATPVTEISKAAAKWLDEEIVSD